MKKYLTPISYPTMQHLRKLSLESINYFRTTLLVFPFFFVIPYALHPSLNPLITFCRIKPSLYLFCLFSIRISRVGLEINEKVYILYICIMYTQYTNTVCLHLLIYPDNQCKLHTRQREEDKYRAFTRELYTITECTLTASLIGLVYSLCH